MNAVTVIQQERVVGIALPEDMTFDAWLEVGRDLFRQRRDIDWQIGDWGAHGKRHFRDDPQFQLMLEGLGIEPKRIEAAAKVATVFPPHCRASAVSFEVHQKLANVDPDDRLQMLRRAEREHWTPKKAHHELVEYRYSQGQLLDEDDESTRKAVEIIRAWNRADPEAREYFFELARLADFGPIDEDKAYA